MSSFQANPFQKKPSTLPSTRSCFDKTLKREKIFSPKSNCLKIPFHSLPIICAQQLRRKKKVFFYLKVKISLASRLDTELISICYAFSQKPGIIWNIIIFCSPCIIKFKLSDLMLEWAINNWKTWSGFKLSLR